MFKNEHLLGIMYSKLNMVNFVPIISIIFVCRNSTTLSVSLSYRNRLLGLKKKIAVLTKRPKLIILHVPNFSF